MSNITSESVSSISARRTDNQGLWQIETRYRGGNAEEYLIDARILRHAFQETIAALELVLYEAKLCGFSVEAKDVKTLTNGRYAIYLVQPPKNK